MQALPDSTLADGTQGSDLAKLIYRFKPIVKETALEDVLRSPSWHPKEYTLSFKTTSIPYKGRSHHHECDIFPFFSGKRPPSLHQAWKPKIPRLILFSAGNDNVHKGDGCTYYGSCYQTQYTGAWAPPAQRCNEVIHSPTQESSKHAQNIQSPFFKSIC